MASPQEPPNYDTALGSNSREQLGEGEPVCLVLDGTLIYPLGQSSRPLFEISNPPTEAGATIYGVERIRYRVTGSDGEGDIKSRSDHIYDFRKSAEIARDVEISGKSSKHAYKLVTMTGGLKWHSCKASGHFKAARSVKQRVKERDQIDWVNESGDLVAIETRAARQSDGTISGSPRLDVKVAMPTKDFDLLVTCWAARVWKESQKDTSEPMSWKKFKRIASGNTTPGFGKNFMGAG